MCILCVEQGMMKEKKLEQGSERRKRSVKMRKWQETGPDELHLIPNTTI